MKKLLAMLLALVMVVGLFAACGGEKTDDEKKDDKTGDSTPVESSSEESEPEESANSNVNFFTAIVEDEDGNPMEGVMVQFCDENGCMPAMTDAEGKASCQTPNEKTVKIMEMPEGYTYATEQEEWDFAEGDEVTIVLKAVETDPTEDSVPEEVTE